VCSDALSGDNQYTWHCVVAVDRVQNSSLYVHGQVRKEAGPFTLVINLCCELKLARSERDLTFIKEGIDIPHSSVNHIHICQRTCTTYNTLANVCQVVYHCCLWLLFSTQLRFPTTLLFLFISVVQKPPLHDSSVVATSWVPLACCCCPAYSSAHCMHALLLAGDTTQHCFNLQTTQPLQSFFIVIGQDRHKGHRSDCT
jgi:hypothetical protein